MPHYFKKDNLGNPIKLNGAVVVFERSGENNGVRVVQDGEVELLALLNGYADARKMGVRRISPENYESLKKKPGRITPPPSLLPPVRVFDRESALPKESRTPPAPLKTPLAVGVAVSPTPPPPSGPPKPSAALQELLREQKKEVPPITPEAAAATGPKTRVRRAKKSDVEPTAPQETPQS